MSAFPSASASVAFDRLAQDADEAIHQGVVTLGGIDYPAAVVFEEITWEMTEAGSELIQRFNCSINKDKLSARPALGAALLCDEKEFRVTGVDGDNATDASWYLRGLRKVKKGDKP